jgi:hypothetical protein
MSLLQNLTVGAMGMDCSASEAWLGQWFVGHERFARASAHWGKADDTLQEAIGSMLGWCEPNGERAPVPPAIQSDYEWCVAKACELLAPSDYA